MIRQAVSCDVCGTEKKETNHWFVAYETAGELRVSGWNSRNRLRAGSKHLCGQACLHKLADDFMARVVGGKTLRSGERTDLPPEGAVDTSLLNMAPPALEIESPAHLLTAAGIVPQPSPLRPPALVRMPEHGPAERSSPAPGFQESLRVGGMGRHEEAWRRERERTIRAERG